ncbi:hypothetical protein N7495_008122 [Penicillium taxi]|uniref:uncharacterized protein n=1 Tax=Penicillium taxi TaxID=168475 RepID=UPI002545AEA0|nr:uncharacterized protein N7495_008122 [Penicillium taxi]KAJ5888081.1 hypothetical protein N7495_008122 [Penicillium taxi]
MAIAVGHHTQCFSFPTTKKNTTWTPSALETPVNEKGCNAATGSCDFFAASHTLNAIESIYLVSGYSSELGYNSIAKIIAVSIYSEDEESDSEDYSTSSQDNELKR